MRKSILMFLLFLFILFSGCATLGIGDLLETTLLLPFAVTGSVLSEVDSFLFGTGYEEEYTSTIPTPKREETHAPVYEEKKTINRNKYGNIILD